MQLAEEIKVKGREAMIPKLEAVARSLWQRTLAKDLDVAAFHAALVQ